MKGQTHDLMEIRGAIKAVQTEIAKHQPCSDTCCEAWPWREVAIRSVGCMGRMADMLQDQTTQNQTLEQDDAHMKDSVRRSQKAIKELNARGSVHNRSSPRAHCGSAGI